MRLLPNRVSAKQDDSFDDKDCIVTIKPFQYISTGLRFPHSYFSYQSLHLFPLDTTHASNDKLREVYFQSLVHATVALFEQRTGGVTCDFVPLFY
jgi:hypothetical protein